MSSLKKPSRQIAQERVTQTIDALEMLEEKNQSLEMRGLELAVDAVKRVSNGMSDPLVLQITLKIENVLTQRRNGIVLRFGNSPDE